ncbi:MAG: aminotransferase class I/II, partial [Pseudomonadota bacterium]
PSRTNFTLIPFASPEDAASADRALRAEGVLMRAVAGSGLPHALRATIGQPDEMALAATILETWSRR